MMRNLHYLMKALWKEMTESRHPGNSLQHRPTSHDSDAGLQKLPTQ